MCCLLLHPFLPNFPFFGRYLLIYLVELQDGLSEKLVWFNTKVGGVCVYVFLLPGYNRYTHQSLCNIFLYYLQDCKDGMLLFYQQGIKMHL